MTLSVYSGSGAAVEPRGSSRLPGPALAMGLLAIAIVLSASPARAGLSYNLDASTTFNGGIRVDANFDNGAKSFKVRTNAGSFLTSWTTDNVFGSANTPFLSYCVDISTFLDGGKVRPAIVSTHTSTASDFQGVVRDIQAAGWVFNNYAAMTLADLQTEFNLTTLTQRQAEAALQLAIWEAAYDPLGGASGSKGYLGGGALTFSKAAVNSANANVVDLANAILQNRLKDPTGRSAIGFIDYPPNSNAISPDNQDQLFAVPLGGPANAVPEPSTLAMAAVGGLFGLGTLVRRRLTRSTPCS